MTAWLRSALVRFPRRHVPTWGTRAGERDVPLAQLVSPLRYDIVIRARFFRYYEDNRELFASDIREFVRRALDHSYGQYYRHIALVRYRPAVLAEQRRLHSAFEDRVRRTAALWESYRQRGFDPRFPIILRVPGRSTSFGTKAVRRSYYVGDGCHRLAMLLADGRTHLPRSWHRLDLVPLSTVLDNTSMLLPHLAVSDEEYCSFVSQGYLEHEVGDVGALIDAVARTSPSMSEELVRVLSADGRLPAAPVAGAARRPPRTGTA